MERLCKLTESSAFEVAGARLSLDNGDAAKTRSSEKKNARDQFSRSPHSWNRPL